MSCRTTLGLCALALLVSTAVRSVGGAEEPVRASAVLAGTPEEEREAALETEIRGFLAHYIETLEAKDRAAIRALFVEDARFAWFTDGVQSYASADDVLAGMDRYAGVEFHTELSAVEVLSLTARFASASSSFHTRLTIPGADDFEYGGVITWLLERPEAGGAWRVLQGHTSTPGGPPK